MSRQILIAVAAALASAVLPSTACYAQSARSERGEAARLERMQRLDAAHFERTARLEDDEMEITAQINTSEGFRHRGGFTDRVRSDNFLRAFINKRTGAAMLQVYQTIVYGPPFRNFQSVNYQTPEGLQPTRLTEIPGNTPDCSYGSCVHTDALAFEVTEDTLRSIASSDQPLWRFRYNAQSGDDWNDNMSRAEVVGFLRRVDAYRATLRPR